MPESSGPDRSADVIVHGAPQDMPQFYTTTSSPAYNIPPPPGFIILPPSSTPRFHTGGNIEDLLGDVQHTNLSPGHYLQEDSVFYCNTRKIILCHEPCRCKRQENPAESKTFTSETNQGTQTKKNYVTQKNIELTYDYPRAIPIPSPSPTPERSQTTTEVASTVVFVQRKIPMKPRSKFGFLFRSQSAPVGENEEPIYATVTKLPKRLRKAELDNLERELSYNVGQTNHDTIYEHQTPVQSRLALNTETTSDQTSDTKGKSSKCNGTSKKDKDSDSNEPVKTVIAQRPDTPKAKKRKRISLVFKKRGTKSKEKNKNKENDNRLGNGIHPHFQESDSERLTESIVQEIRIPNEEPRVRRCRHARPRVHSSCSSGPRYRRDSCQDATTSHSEHERSQSISSSVSIASAATHKSRKLSLPQDGNIPWCGCWGASCL